MGFLRSMTFVDVYAPHLPQKTYGPMELKECVGWMSSTTRAKVWMSFHSWSRVTTMGPGRCLRVLATLSARVSLGGRAPVATAAAKPTPIHLATAAVSTRWFSHFSSAASEQLGWSLAPFLAARSA